MLDPLQSWTWGAVQDPFGAWLWLKCSFLPLARLAALGEPTVITSLSFAASLSPEDFWPLGLGKHWDGKDEDFSK